MWDPFFDILSRRWKDIPYDIVLNTETLGYDCPYLPVKVLHPSDPKKKWAPRLRDILQQLNTETVLLLLDDFFLYDDVDGENIARCVDAIEKNPNITNFTIWKMNDGEQSERFPGYARRPDGSVNRHNAIAGVWRRSRLIELLGYDEDAWEWEENGGKRIEKTTEEFYCTARDAALAVPYDFIRYGVSGGLWFKDTVELFARYGIDFDFSKRGFFEPEDQYLIAFIAMKFKLDSKLYIDTGGGFNEQQIIETRDIQKTGPFAQRYELPRGVKDIVRWDPSSFVGFSLERFSITLHYENGREKSVPLSKTLTNGVVVDDSLVFLEQDPHIFIPLGGRPAAVSFAGEAVCPLPRERIKSALAATPAPNRLLSLRLSARAKPRVSAREKRYQYSKLFLSGGVVLEPPDPLYSGAFEQRHDIASNTARRLRWDPGEEGGFALRGLSVTAVWPNGKTKALRYSNTGETKPNGDLFFRYTDPQVYFNAPRGAAEIVLSGEIINPAPESYYSK